MVRLDKYRRDIAANFEYENPWCSPFLFNSNGKPLSEFLFTKL